MLHNLCKNKGNRDLKHYQKGLSIVTLDLLRRQRY